MYDIPEAELSAARHALDAFGVPENADIEFIKHRENHVYREIVRMLTAAIRNEFVNPRHLYPQLVHRETFAR